MSEYYKMMYEKLIKKGKKHKISLLSQSLLLLSLLCLVYFFIVINKTPTSEDRNPLISLLISAVSLFLSQKIAFQTADKNLELSRDIKISEEILENLISEIEKSIKETLDTIKWICGLAGTFTILALTIFFNVSFQSIIKIGGKEKLSSLININNMFQLLQFTLFFCSIVLLVYFTMTLLLVRKKICCICYIMSDTLKKKKRRMI